MDSQDTAIAEPERHRAIPTQGDLALLDDPVAQRLLAAAIPARLAYNGLDGTPRVVPIWFHWTGDEIVIGTEPDTPKIAALQARPDVALTIDRQEAPYHVLMLRGRARVAIVDGMPPEVVAAADRYLGPKAGRTWVAQMAKLYPQMARIAVRPVWVGLLDFETRFPQSVSRLMAAPGAALEAPSSAPTD